MGVSMSIFFPSWTGFHYRIEGQDTHSHIRTTVYNYSSVRTRFECSAFTNRLIRARTSFLFHQPNSHSDNITAPFEGSVDDHGSPSTHMRSSVSLNRPYLLRNTLPITKLPRTPKVTYTTSATMMQTTRQENQSVLWLSIMLSQITTEESIMVTMPNQTRDISGPCPKGICPSMSLL